MSILSDIKHFFNSFDLDSSIGNETPECSCTHASVGESSSSPYLYNTHARMRFLDAFSTKDLVGNFVTFFPQYTPQYTCS